MDQELQLLKIQLENLNSLVNEISSIQNMDEFFRIKKKLSMEKIESQKIYCSVLSQLEINLENTKKTLQDTFESVKKMLIEEINEKIQKYHNPSLVDPIQYPNENTIYKLYNDFRITSEKRDWAYGQRNWFMKESPIGTNSEIKFPESNGNSTYAIMTYDQCLEIYELFKNYLSLS